MKILSVDDSSIVRKIVQSAVGALGYEFIGAQDSDEALEILKGHHKEIALILLDWNMPGTDGYELLKMLKDNDQFKHIPVMMVTTESEKQNVVSAVKAGAINYLTKPFSNEDLLIKIMECLGGEG